MTQHFDVIVLGGRLSSLLTAALLAKRGLRGMLVDQGELASMDPGLLYDLVYAENDSRVMQVVHAELGVREDLRQKSKAIDPLLQIILPDERIDLHPERPRLLAEIGRGYGAAAQKAMEPFLHQLAQVESEAGSFLVESEELPATGFFARRAYDASLRRHEAITKSLAESKLLDGLPPLLAETLLAPLPFLTHLDARKSEDVRMGRFARPLLRLLRGLSRIDAVKGLRELFLNVATHRAFEIKKSAVESIEPGAKQIEVRVSGQRDRITTEVLIDASADLSGLDVVPSSLRKKDLAIALQSAKPKGFLHTISLEVDEDVIPPGLADHALLLNGRRDRSRVDLGDPDSEDRPIWLSRRPATEKGRVQLVAAHPVSMVRAHAQRLDELEEVMRRRVERLIPFLMDGKPELHALSGQSAIKHKQPVLSHPLYDPTLDPRAGMTGIPMSTGWKNVLVAGPTVLPGLGVEGEYLSALKAADECETLVSGKKKKKSLAPA